MCISSCFKFLLYWNRQWIMYTDWRRWQWLLCWTRFISGSAVKSSVIVMSVIISNYLKISPVFNSSVGVWWAQPSSHCQFIILQYHALFTLLWPVGGAGCKQLIWIQSVCKGLWTLSHNNYDELFLQIKEKYFKNVNKPVLTCLRWEALSLTVKSRCSKSCYPLKLTFTKITHLNVFPWKKIH